MKILTRLSRSERSVGIKKKLIFQAKVRKFACFSFQLIIFIGSTSFSFADQKLTTEQLLPEDQVLFVDTLKAEGYNWHGRFKIDFFNPNKEESKYLRFIFPTSVHTLEYLNEHASWIEQPEDVDADFQAELIMSAERLLEYDILKIAELWDLKDILAWHFASLNGYSDLNTLPARAISISFNKRFYNYHYQMGKKANLNEIALAIGLFGTNTEIPDALYQKLLEQTQVRGFNIPLEPMILYQNDTCIHLFGTGSVSFPNDIPYDVILVQSSCVIEGIRFEVSNTLKVPDITSANQIIASSISLAKTIDEYLSGVEVKYLN